MEAMGYHDLKEEQFYNSAMCAAAYAKGLDKGNKAWFIGAQGMKQALVDEGFVITDTDPDFVFIGLDKNADYHSYSKALQLLLNGALLVGTNKDRILAKPSGFEMGNGSVVKMFEYATGQHSPDLAKPAMPILDFLLKKEGLSKNDIVLVGDNLETDIALGYNNGVQTILTESGVHTRKDTDRLGIHPDIIVDSLQSVDWLRIAQSE
jgi:4-nitrophenyl phosphatase